LAFVLAIATAILSATAEAALKLRDARICLLDFAIASWFGVLDRLAPTSPHFSNGGRFSGAGSAALGA
jgi:hypothetical protein